MSKPARPTDTRSAFDKPRTFFVTTSTAGRTSLFQTDRMSNLLIDVLRTHTLSGKFRVHDFVVMPNHIHILITLPGEMTIEKAMQLIKGAFSFRVKREAGFNGEIWQRGFSEVGIRDIASFQEHRTYIAQNPVRACLANSPEQYVYSSARLRMLKTCSG